MSLGVKMPEITNKEMHLPNPLTSERCCLSFAKFYELCPTPAYPGFLECPQDDYVTSFWPTILLKEVLIKLELLPNSALDRGSFGCLLMTEVHLVCSGNQSLSNLCHARGLRSWHWYRHIAVTNSPLATLLASGIIRIKWNFAVGLLKLSFIFSFFPRFCFFDRCYPRCLHNCRCLLSWFLFFISPIAQNSFYGTKSESVNMR